MPPRQKDGQIILPEFENGRIVGRETVIDKNYSATLLGVMKRPEDEEEENRFIFCEGFSEAMRSNDILGTMNLTPYNPLRAPSVDSAHFSINTKPAEQSKGYGTVLMNAGAQYCRNTRVQNMRGDFSRKGAHKKRETFYERLGIPVIWENNSQIIKFNVDNPLLNTIKFEEDKAVAKLLHSIPELQRYT